jgi:hypothetical protein
MISFITSALTKSIKKPDGKGGQFFWPEQTNLNPG